MASILNIDENKIVFSLPDCEAEKICVELRQLDQRVGELGQLADHLDQGLKLGLSRPSTYLAGASLLLLISASVSVLISTATSASLLEPTSAYSENRRHVRHIQRHS